MKKTLIAFAAVAAPLAAGAQSAVDAYNFSQTETRGTARFMSMGGAFTALGGDLSTLSQNPAGLGVYRKSEIGATLDKKFLRGLSGSMLFFKCCKCPMQLVRLSAFRRAVPARVPPPSW